MSPQSVEPTRMHRWVVTAAVFAAASLLVAAYVWLRYFFEADWALLAAQFVFLAPPMAATVLAAVAARKAPEASRGRLVWLLIATATGLLVLNEAIQAWVVLSGQPISEAVQAMSDLAAVAAVLIFLSLIGVVSSVDRLDRGRAFRVMLDIVAIGTLVFTLVFRFWVVGLLGTIDRSQALDAVRLAAYASVGILVIIADGIAMNRIRRQGTFLSITLVGAGIGVYGVGVTLWPLWALSAYGGEGAPWHALMVSVLLLVGYELVALGALSRVVDADAPWYGESPVPETGAVWPGLIATTLVFASILVLGWAVLEAPQGSGTQLVYLLALSLATVCLVGRTALSSAETWRLQSLATTDSLTGSYNRRVLGERVSELLAISKRSGAPFALAVVNLDDFSAVNTKHGHDVGDEVLEAVATSLGREAGADNVFRMVGDEFVVLLPPDSPPDVQDRALQLLKAIDGVDTKGVRVSASIGTASSSSDADTADDLVRKAEAAQVWAKYHGKHCVVEYDEELSRGPTVGGGYSLLEAQGSLDLALALVALGDARDVAAHRHARNVAALARTLAIHAGLDTETVDKIEIAAVLHDVGKVAIPDTSTVGRAERLIRRKALREHPIIGAQLIESLGISDVAAWVRSHHERWDGDGYPDALVGNEISFGARIIALADAYDSMTEGSSALRPTSKGAALQEIDLGIGTRFDPKLAELFIAMVGTSSRLGWVDSWKIA